MRKNIEYLQSKGRGRPAVKTQKKNLPDEKKVKLASALPGDRGSVVAKVQTKSLPAG